MTALFNSLVQAWSAYPFMQGAILIGLLLSITSGVIGSYIVVKRIVFISGGIAHSVLGGFGVALYVRRVFSVEWLEPIHGAFLAAIISAALIGVMTLHFKQRSDTVIATIWTFGMSMGAIFISLTPGYNVELSQYFFGNILWATNRDIYSLLILDLIVLFVTCFFHYRFLAIFFDEEQAMLQKQPVKWLYFLLLSLVAITVVCLIQIVGAILVIAILSLPASIANMYTKSLLKMMVLASALELGIAGLGIVISYFLNWPVGATMALIATSLYLLHLMMKQGG